MTYWFGKTWGAPCCDEDEHVTTPAWTRCERCKEPIMPEDQGVMMPHVSESPIDGTVRVRRFVYHLDCHLKAFQPHGPECPCCRGVEPRKHAPSCRDSDSPWCNCIPMPEGR